MIIPEWLSAALVFAAAPKAACIFAQSEVGTELDYKDVRLSRARVRASPYAAPKVYGLALSQELHKLRTQLDNAQHHVGSLLLPSLSSAKRTRLAAIWESRAMQRS